MNSSHADFVAELADRFGPLVFATAYRILGNRDETNDAYQEVFLKLMKLQPTIPADAANQWGAYLRVAASRCAIDVLHRRPRWDSGNDELLETIQAPSGENPRAVADRHQRAEMLRRALASLPPRDAHVFSLRHFEEMSYEEIAREEGLSVSAVGVILHRSAQRLRNILQPEECSSPRVSKAIADNCEEANHG